MSAALAGTQLTVDRGGRCILAAEEVSLAPGTLTAILGPNGSGKSTLLRVLAGLWSGGDGIVTLGGEPLARMTRKHVARRVSFLPQDTRSDFAFTVEETVAMGRYPHRGRFEAERDADRLAIESAISTCDLDELRQRTVDRLSGGERQRVAIARCLAADPEVLLLDEPTAHLDLEHTLGIFALCRALADAGGTIAVATHDLATVCRYATTVVLLRAGRIVASGSTAAVLTPDACREVFAVDTEVVATKNGQAALVFSSFS
jgi:iron complex transport system ATP-binding protein